MALHFAAYKGEGRKTDTLIRTITSLRHGQKVQYSHIELMKGPVSTHSKGYRFQRCLAASKRDGSVVREKEIIFKSDHWDFYRVTRFFNPWIDAQAFLGMPYDTLGAVLCVTPFAREKKDRWFCSQMLAHLMFQPTPEIFDPQMVVNRALMLGATKEIG